MSQMKGGGERGAILRRRTKHDDDHPDEIVLDILAKLPVKSLLRFRCVCKPWYSSIANPSFISTHHLNHSHLHHHSYVIHIPRNVPIPFFPGSSHSSDQVCTLACHRTFETISEFRVPFTFQSGFSHFVGSCNGMLCFTSSRSWSNVVYLWNTCIRKFKRLPNSQLSIMSLGIGFDSQNNDFKVVGIPRTFAKPKPPPEVEVYSLSSDSWKRVELGISWRPNVVSHKFNCVLTFPFVSGHLHWMIEMIEEGGGQEKHDTSTILSFDVNSEKFKELPLPDDEGSCITKCVTSFKGKLALIKFGNGTQPHITRCSIWVMREYGVIDSWNNLYILSIENLTDLIGFTKDGLLIRNSSGQVSTDSELESKDKSVLIDLETLHEKEISTHAKYGFDEAT
nr:F-box/kelch-repeat protein At3g23880-like [Quercus suber]XP_023920378.1 F-box/kelch-repeat protein At3g23880-like [Quercus suber]XP_023920379.1 F-box/kelch-repeat protein At3g23880-like [Quercus suber]